MVGAPNTPQSRRWPRSTPRDADAATLARAEKLVRQVDGSRLLHLNSYLTFHDAVIGRLLIAAGQPAKGARTVGDGTAPRGRNRNALLRRRADARTRANTSPSRKNAAPPWPPRSRRTAPRRDTVRITLLLDSFDLLGEADRSELADAGAPFAGDARWPEFARAQRILA